VNKRAIVDSLLLGAGYVPDGIAGHGVWGTYRVDYYPYDPDRAAALMQEAGLTLFEGRWHDQGEPVVFRFYVPDGRYVKDRVIGEFVTQQLEDFGLTVELEVAPWSIWASNSRARANALEIDGGMNGFSLVHPVINWANDLHCRNENSRQTGHCDPVFDDLIDRATQTFDEDEQRSLYEQAQQMAIEKAMYLLLYGQSPVWGVRDGIQGLSFTPNEIPITDQVYIE